MKKLTTGTPVATGTHSSRTMMEEGAERFKNRGWETMAQNTNGTVPTKVKASLRKKVFICLAH